MALSRLQTLAVSSAIAGSVGDVEEVVIDGERVDDLAGVTARATKIADYEASSIGRRFDAGARWILAKKEQPRSGKLSTLAKRMKAKARASRVGEKTLQLKDKALRTELGGKLGRVISSDPERCATTTNVEIHYTDGRFETRRVSVTDVARTVRLERFSIAASALSFIPIIPFLGIAVPWAAAAVSTLGAGVATLRGDQDMASRWFRVAEKHFASGVAHIAPFVGSAVSASMMMADIADIEEVARKAKPQ